MFRRLKLTVEDSRGRRRSGFVSLTQDSTAIIGRADSSFLVLDDGQIENQHALIAIRNGEATLKPLCHERILHNEAPVSRDVPLQHGDRFMLAPGVMMDVEERRGLGSLTRGELAIVGTIMLLIFGAWGYAFQIAMIDDDRGPTANEQKINSRLDSWLRSAVETNIDQPKFDPNVLTLFREGLRRRAANDRAAASDTFGDLILVMSAIRPRFAQQDTFQQMAVKNPRALVELANAPDNLRLNDITYAAALYQHVQELMKR